MKQSRYLVNTWEKRINTWEVTKIILSKVLINFCVGSNSGLI